MISFFGSLAHNFQLDKPHHLQYDLVYDAGERLLYL
jgi:hypothetical protein